MSAGTPPSGGPGPACPPGPDGGNVKNGERFGASIASGTDVVVVGAPGDDAGGEDAGAAFAYDRSACPLYVLHSPTPAAGDGFGAAAAFVGPTVVVGVPFADLQTPIVPSLGSLSRRSRQSSRVRSLLSYRN